MVRELKFDSRDYTRIREGFLQMNLDDGETDGAFKMYRQMVEDGSRKGVYDFYIPFFKAKKLQRSPYWENAPPMVTFSDDLTGGSYQIS